jgi:rod shape determining protein RodA
MFRNYDIRKLDFFVILLVILLVIIGITSIGSATKVYAEEGTDVYVKKQIIGFIVGFVIMSIVAIMDYHFIARFQWIIYVLNIVLLLLVFIIGDNSHGATRWIYIGSSYSIQPSEFAKIFMTIFMAKYIDSNKERINKPFVLGSIFLLMLIPMFLIMKEPDLSTSMVLIFLLVLQLFIMGISYKYILGAVGVIVPLAIAGFWYIQQPGQKLLEDYQAGRILSLFYPEKYALSTALQTTNSIQAIGSGKLTGKGLYLGKLNQYDYLPEPQTDFIFSIIGEEFGFVGCSIVLTLIFVLVARCIWISKDSVDDLGKLIIIGFVAIITFQTFINVGVATGILPNTGIPLPFISYGLSSLWTNMIGLGIVLNISMQRKK